MLKSGDKIRLKCDTCGGSFLDQYTKVICSYCERREKREQIEEFIAYLKKLSSSLGEGVTTKQIDTLIEKYEARKNEL